MRHLTGTAALPPNGAPRRFACAVAAVWIAVTAAAFWFGFLLAGYVLGAAIIVVAGIVSTTHFCVPSNIYRLVFERSTAIGE